MIVVIVNYSLQVLLKWSIIFLFVVVCSFSVTLAICDKDSSTTYFKVSNTLVAPHPPERTDVIKRKRANHAQHRRDNTNSEIRLYCEERTASEESNTNSFDADS